MTQTHRLLIVEDDPVFHRLYQRTLGPHFSWRLAISLKDARAQLKAARPDAVLLDWSLPDGECLPLIEEIRRSEATKHVLVLVVTARTHPDDQVEALALGADDFLSKPIDPRILSARLNALARRKGRSWNARTPIELNGLRYEPGTGRVTLDGADVALGLKELAVLEIFLERPDVVRSPEAIWERVWGHHHGKWWRHTLIVTIANLRTALGHWGDQIQSRRGLGYILEPGS